MSPEGEGRRPAHTFRGASVAEIRRRVLIERRDLSEAELRALRSDTRSGVREICRRLERLLDRERAERRRLERLLDYEGRLRRAGVERVAGVDEAGVGPLAGPLVAAAVVLPSNRALPPGVDDSKRLSAAAREKLAEALWAVADIGVGIAEVEEIDRLNVYHAGLLAMRRAVAALNPLPGHLLVDGRGIPDWSLGQTRIVKGDRLSYSIAAASIIAKTHRDALMLEAHRLFPHYGFASHKGYPAPTHQAALARYGPCPLHRRSFAAVSEFAGAFSPRFYSLRARLREIDSVERIAALSRETSPLPDAERRRLLALAAARAKALNARPSRGSGGGSGF